MLFQDIKFGDILQGLKCPLHSAFYALRIRVSVMELYGDELLISHAFNASLQFYCPYCTRSPFVEMIPYIMKLSLRLMNCYTVDTVYFAGKTILLHAKIYSILTKISAY